MSWGRDASPRALTIEVIAYLVPASLVVLLFLDISTEAKLIIILILAVLAFLNFVAFVGLLERWKRRWDSSVRERLIRRHPEFVTELYRLHDRIETVIYRRAADKPSLALNVVELMKPASPSDPNPSGDKDFAEKFEMVQRHFNWISQRVKDHREGRKRWTSPDFANVLREIGDHLLSVNAILETVYRSVPKNETMREDLFASWEAFREEYATLIREWQAFTERVDETIKYGTKRTIPPPRHLV